MTGKCSTTHRIAYIATLHCEMFVLKNRHASGLSGANCHARLNHSKQLLRHIHLMMLAQICWLTNRYLQWLHRNPKESPTVRNCSNQERRRNKTPAHTINVQTATSGRLNTSFIFVDHLSQVCWGLLSKCDVVITVTARRILNLQRVLDLSTGQRTRGLGAWAWDDQLSF